MNNLKAVLYDCHRNLIESKSDLSLIITDIKVICSNGSVNYCKLLMSLVDPDLSRLICDDKDDLLIICPDISKQEFMNHYSSIFERNIKKETQKILSQGNARQDTSNYSELKNNEFNAQSDDALNCQVQSKDVLDVVAGHQLDIKPEHLCDLCGGAFITYEKLKRHRYNVHPDPDSPKKTFPCPECVKKFSSKMFLVKHRKLVHTSTSQQCKICPKTFKNLVLLQRHEKAHKYATEKFECNICGKKSSKKSNHERHLRLHSSNEIQKFSCDICPMKFPLKQYLDRHRILHADDVHVSCPNCDRSFKRSDNMKRHFKKCQK